MGILKIDNSARLHLLPAQGMRWVCSVFGNHYALLFRLNSTAKPLLTPSLQAVLAERCGQSHFPTQDQLNEQLRDAPPPPKSLCISALTVLGTGKPTGPYNPIR